MRKKVNSCINCEKPCMLFCPLRDESYEYYCDDCGEETKLYEFEDKELCIDCIKTYLDEIN